MLQQERVSFLNLHDCFIYTYMFYIQRVLKDLLVEKIPRVTEHLDKLK